MNLLVKVAGEDKGGLSLVKQLNQETSGLSGIAKTAGIAVAGLGLAAGAAAVGGIAASVNAASDFEQQMSAVKAVSGATADEMQQLSGLALKLGKDTSFSAGEAAAGIEELVKGGIATADILGGAGKAALDLAAAGSIDVAEAATIASNAVGQFGDEAKAFAGGPGQFLSHAADLIAGAANASALDVGQFKMSMQAAGAVAATVGFSFDDLAEGIAIMGKAGITGSDAGTSLKTMMLNLTPSTDKAATAMQELGIMSFNSQEAMTRLAANGIAPAAAGSSELYNQTLKLTLGLSQSSGITAQNMKDFSKMSQEVGLTSNAFFDATGKVKSMSEVAQVLQESTKNLTQEQKLSTLQTLFGSDAIRAAAVLAKEGAAGFDTMAGAMGKVTAASVGAEKLNNFKGSITALQGSLETAGITLGMAFLPLLKSMTDGVTGVVNQMIPFLEVMGPKLVAGVGQGINFLKSIDLTPFMALWEAAQIQIEFFVDVVKQALGGDVAGAIKFFLDGMQETRTDLVETLAGWAASFVEWVAPFIPPLLEQLGIAVAAILEWVIGNAPAILEQLGVWAEKFVAWVAPLIPPLLVELGILAGKILAWVADQAAEIGQKFITEWLPPALAWAKQAAADAPGKLADLIVATLNWVQAEGPHLARTFLAEWVPAALEWVADATIKITPLLVTMFATIARWIVTEGVPRLAQAFLQFNVWLVNEGAPAALRAAGAVGEAIVSGAIAGIGRMIPNLANKAAQMANAALQAAKDALLSHSPSQRFEDEVGITIPQGTAVGIDRGMPALLDTMDRAMDALAAVGASGMETVVDRMTEAWNASASNLTDAMTESNRTWGDLAGSGGSGSGGSGGGGGGGRSEPPNTDGQTAPGQFQSDPLYRQLQENKRHGNVPGKLSTDYGNGITYNAEMDTTRTGKPHEGKSAYYSVLYRMNTLLSNGQATNVQDAFRRAVQWVIDNTTPAGRAGLGWTIGAGAGAGTGAGADVDYGAMTDAQLDTLIDSGSMAPGLIAEVRKRAPVGYGGFRARGGTVGAGMAYTVGESGPETLYMGRQSGWVAPNGGGGIDYERLAAAIAKACASQPIIMQMNGQEMGRVLRAEIQRYLRRNASATLAGT